MFSKLADAELWDAVVSDSTRAFTVLYNRHWKQLYQTVNHYLKDEFVAREITHDVFLSLWTKRKHLKISNFQGYIHAAARYHVFSHLKAAKVDIVEYMDQFSKTESLVVDNTIGDKLRYSELESQLSQLLKALPRRCQEIFWLSRIESLSNEEIAGKLNISKRTVENQLTIALRHLRLSYSNISFYFVLLFLLSFNK
ncbi:MAG: RNA polymerase sigma-70 factor [Bacteroidetes bacterium]|nr:RNA polymerase sigma-70 factor [Bacteroidota bacterium]